MKNKAIIYGRISTNETRQDVSRQVEDLRSLCKQKRYEVIGEVTEQISGAKTNEQRNGIQELLKRARKKEFNKVVVTEISRLGRNPFQVQRVVEELTDLGISVLVQNLGIETLDSNCKRNPMTDMMLSIACQFSSVERSWLIERINSGIAKAKRSGKHCGRPFNTKQSKEATLKKYSGVVKDLKHRIPLRKIAKLHEVSVVTVMKVKRILSEGKERRVA